MDDKFLIQCLIHGIVAAEYPNRQPSPSDAFLLILLNYGKQLNEINEKQKQRNKQPV